MESDPRVFKIEFTPPSPIFRGAYRLAAGALERAFLLRRLDQVHAAARSAASLSEFLAKSLALLGVEVEASPATLSRIPAKGPVVVVANHPFGALEGVILARLLLQVRPDVKVMANYLLGRIPELRDLFVFVDPFDSSRSVEHNLRPLRESIRWVKEGGLLAVFPAGEVAHLNHRNGIISDPPWNPVVARIALKGGASVVPVYFPGQNSHLFHTMGLLHPRLRTALLPRELFNKRGRIVTPQVGGPIPPARLERFANHQDLTSYLRWRTYLLKETSPRSGLFRSRRHRSQAPHSGPEPLAPPESPTRLAQEIAALPPRQILTRHGEFLVFYAHAPQIPFLLPEIGRLREFTFRQVGEGTGRARDLDHFDDYYVHLCLWDQQAQRLVGSYRLGLADRIIAEHGVEGLYTATLFRFHKDFFRHISPALELGRSFVQPDYQRSYAGLMLLWKGIGQFILQEPRYRFIFGPVSISNDYHRVSRQLVVEFLQNQAPSPLAKLVTPRNPVRFGPSKGLGYRRFLANLSSIDEVSEIIADLEGPGRGAPILVKQYLKLAARCLTQNLDPDFGDVLDCLLVSDLLEVDARTMTRYLGPAGKEAFLAHHQGRGHRVSRSG
ncbi:MAG: lysophospholipid acyltransferase family protein [Deltaproteobacteria bacterium]|nr:lysophospholipid acyltransferase family protein [Deltaproteobacteria bacterium]